MSILPSVSVPAAPLQPGVADEGVLSTLSSLAAGVAQALKKVGTPGHPTAPARPGSVKHVPVLRPRTTAKSSPLTGAPRAVPLPSRGYAAVSSSSGTLTKTELKFLDDKHLSIQDKLSIFMQKVMEKTDRELVDQMKAMEAKKSGGSSSSGSSSYSSSSGSAGSSSSSSRGFDLFGFMKSILPPLGELENFFGKTLLNQILSQLGSAILGSLATAVGVPALAPAAMAIGSKLGGTVSSAVSSPATGSSASSSSSTSSGSGDEVDERIDAIKLQRLVEKQNQLFATISNIMKTTHDAAMTAVNNLR